MVKLILIALAAILLGSSAPAPAPALQNVTIRAEVIGTLPSGSTAPIGFYEARGATLAEAMQNAQTLEQQIRTTATAQQTR